MNLTKREFIMGEDWDEQIRATMNHETSLGEMLLGALYHPELPGGTADFAMGVPYKLGELTVYRNARNPYPKELEKSPYEHVTTMTELWKEVSLRFAKEPCLGIRRILSVRSNEEQSQEKFTLGPYEWLSYEDVNELIHDFSRGMKKLTHLCPTENIKFFAETSMEWQIAFQACMRRGLVVATSYANLGVDAVVHGIEETKSSVIFSDATLIDTLEKVVDKCALVKYIIFTKDRRPITYKNCITSDMFKERFKLKNVKCFSFEQVVEFGKLSIHEFLSFASPSENDEDMSIHEALIASFPSLNEDNDDDELDPISPQSLCVIMYTSGSTGNPKGVMISHENLLAGIAGGTSSIPIMRPGDIFLAYLPLAHILEMLTECGSLAHGAAIGYGSPKTLTDSSLCIDEGTCHGDAPELKPTLLAAVPAIMNKIQSSILAKVQKEGGMKEALFTQAIEMKKKALKEGRDTPFWNYLIFDKLRTKLFGGKIRMVLSGGAPLAEETEVFMNSILCCSVGMGYGLTECCGCATVSWPTDRSLGRVGSPIQCCEISLLDWEEGGYFSKPKDAGMNPRGEILVGGPHVTLGYFKREDLTKESFIVLEGKRWFRTGDIGEIHPDGVLSVIDRKKDLVKLSGGEYISLSAVETIAALTKYVDMAAAFADSTKNFCVLVATTSTTIQADEDLAKLQDLLLKDIQEHCIRKGLPRFSIPGKLYLTRDVWTPESGLVTAALKLKRKNIQEKYSKEIQEMYNPS